MKELSISWENGRHIFSASDFEDLQKVLKIVGWKRGDLVRVVFAPEDEPLTLCNEAPAEKFIKATPDELLEWIFGFREL